VWIKRRWRCPDTDCDTRTWTEHSDHIDAQAVLTRRAGVEACPQVGAHARPVAQVAREFAVCWWTVMNAVIEHDTPLVDDPARVGPVRQLGIVKVRRQRITADLAHELGAVERRTLARHAPRARNWPV
jgi:hypothetical protein